MVMLKQDGFKYEPENDRVLLPKRSKLKEHFSNFQLCEYQTRPDVDFSEVNTTQNVRAAWNSDKWELHFVCKVELETADSAGGSVAGIDLGITTIATVAFPDECVLYPGNSLKEDKHYFTRVKHDIKGGTDRQRSRDGHARNSQIVKRTSSTLSRTLSSQSVSNAVLERLR